MAWYIIQILVSSRCVAENGSYCSMTLVDLGEAIPRTNQSLIVRISYLFDMENDERETKNLSQKYPEVVEVMKKQLADYVNNGRSTLGIPGLNDTDGKSWAELWPLKDYLNEVSLAEMGTKTPQKAKNQEKKSKLNLRNSVPPQRK